MGVWAPGAQEAPSRAVRLQDRSQEAALCSTDRGSVEPEALISKPAGPSPGDAPWESLSCQEPFPISPSFAGRL